MSQAVQQRLLPRDEGEGKGEACPLGRRRVESCVWQARREKREEGMRRGYGRETRKRRLDEGHVLAGGCAGRGQRVKATGERAAFRHRRRMLQQQTRHGRVLLSCLSDPFVSRGDEQSGGGCCCGCGAGVCRRRMDQWRMRDQRGNRARKTRQRRLGEQGQAGAAGGGSLGGFAGGVAGVATDQGSQGKRWRPRGRVGGEWRRTTSDAMMRYRDRGSWRVLVCHPIHHTRPADPRRPGSCTYFVRMFTGSGIPTVRSRTQLARETPLEKATPRTSRSEESKRGLEAPSGPLRSTMGSKSTLLAQATRTPAAILPTSAFAWAPLLGAGRVERGKACDARRWVG